MMPILDLNQKESYVNKKWIHHSGREAIKYPIYENVIVLFKLWLQQEKDSNPNLYLNRLSQNCYLKERTNEYECYPLWKVRPLSNWSNSSSKICQTNFK